MAKAKTSPLADPPMRPASTPEDREQQLIYLATNLVEQRLRDGTATSQEVCHFLKLGSTRERLEREILESQKKLTEAKTESYHSAQQAEETYAKLMETMKRYTGNADEDEY